MEFAETASGRWMVDAPWLEAPVVDDTQFGAYWKARRGILGR